MAEFSKKAKMMVQSQVPDLVTKHAPVPYNLNSDERIRWIRTRVENSLQVEFEQSQQPPKITFKSHEIEVDLPVVKDAFMECLKREDGVNAQILMDYLEDVQHASSALVYWFEKVPGKLELVIKADSVANLVENKQDLPASTQEGSSSDSLKDSRADGSPTSPNLPILPAKDIVAVVTYESVVLHMAVEIMPENLADTNAIYFLRNTSGAVPTPSSAACNPFLLIIAASELMPQHLEMGYLSNQALLMLEQVLQDIYLPLLSSTDFSSMKEYSTTQGEATLETQTTNTRFEELKTELLMTLQRF